MAVLGQVNLFISIVEEFLDPILNSLAFLLFCTFHVYLEDCNNDIESTAHGGFEEAVPVEFVLKFEPGLLELLIIIQDVDGVIFGHRGVN